MIFSRGGGGGVFSRMRESMTKFITSRLESPNDHGKMIRDTKLSILYCVQRQLRWEMRHEQPLLSQTVIPPPPDSNLDIGDNNTSAANHNKNKDKEKERNQMWLDQAIEFVETKSMDDLSLNQLRTELQTMLAKDTARVFETFRVTDQKLDATTEGGGAVGIRMKQKRLEETVKLILMREYYASADGGEGASFQRIKKQEIRDVFAWRGWELDDSDKVENTGSNSGANKEEKEQRDSVNDLNDKNEDENNVTNSRRMINLTKASIIKKEFGYSILTLKSKIPQAGMGVFVDGYADVGSIVGFFPGEVWPREYLFDPAFLASNFSDDDNFQLAFRYDDVLLDSRKSPCHIPAVSGSNPWASAHMVNHPPKFKEVNCKPIALDFTKSMALEEDLKTYIPTLYAEKPKVLGPYVFDMGETFMHGVALIATRDVQNEELLYDYKLREHGRPPWYHVYDEEEVKKRLKR